MSEFPQEGQEWRLHPDFAKRILYQGWYLLLMCEACEEDLPEPVRFEAAALRAMTEEFAGEASPLPAREPC